MNVLKLHEFNVERGSIILPQNGSKSETNRLLVLQALWPGLEISNAAICDDSFVMTRALNRYSGTIDLGHAGSAMRFLTSYFAFLPGSQVVLTGSTRMKQRPISLLVDALRTLGAKINYLEQEGYPPLSIIGTNCSGGQLEISGKISSQYLTSLMLVATKFEDGLTIDLIDKPTSFPYLKMTASILSTLGVQVSITNNQIAIRGPVMDRTLKINIESDWSGASYWYSLIALKPKFVLVLKYFREKSRQGDAVLVKLYEH